MDKMKRRDFLKSTALVCLSAQAFGAEIPKPAARLNILMIAIDDMNISVVGNRKSSEDFLKTIYPDPALRAAVAKRLTPNIDALAQSGRQFLGATCLSPLCGPSRTALMTGVPAHVSGYYAHQTNFRMNEQLRDIVTLPQMLKANGYFTSGIGKVFHRPDVSGEGPAGDWPDSRYSWSRWISAGGGVELVGLELPEMSPRSGNMRFGRSEQPKTQTADWLNSHFTRTLLEKGTASRPDRYTKKTETVTLPEDKPFMVASGIFRPHLPFFAPKEYFDRFPTSEMKIDEQLFEKVVADLDDLPPAGISWTQLTKGKFNSVITRGEAVGGKAGRIEAWKQCVQAYLACVAFSDECAGEILTGLQNSKYKDNTAVVLWSDHGFFLGDKARIAKQCLWQEAIMCNMIMRLPAQKQPGVPSRENVQLGDIYPTLLSLCGLKRPAHIAGEDLSALLEDPAKKLPREYVYSTFMKGNHALTGGGFKYIRYQNGDRELYCLTDDPCEYRNLAKEPAQKERLAKYDAELDRQLEAAQERFKLREKPAGA